MGSPVVLLVSSVGGDAVWISQAQAFCTIHRIRSAEELNGRIKLLCPHALCFEFSHHDPEGLALLQRTKQAYPSLPILMITEEHSEELAVWALRTRVWDYIVKPVLIRELYCSIMTIHELTMAGNTSRLSQASSSSDRLLARSLPPDGRSRAETAVDKARAYIAQNLSGKISGAELADRCAMSYFHFSRTFRRVMGITLREYILRERINKAAQLLLSAPGISVTSAGLKSGFRDLSYFARMFRRYKGVSPSQYHQAMAGSDEHADSHQNALYANGSM